MFCKQISHERSLFNTRITYFNQVGSLKQLHSTFSAGFFTDKKLCCMRALDISKENYVLIEATFIL